MQHERGVSGSVTRSFAVILVVVASAVAVSDASAQRMMGGGGFQSGARGTVTAPGGATRFTPGFNGGGGRMIGRGPDFVGRGPYVGPGYYGSIGPAERYEDDEVPGPPITASRGSRKSKGAVAARTPRSPPSDRKPPATPGTAAVQPTIPYVRYAPNIYAGCAGPADCRDRPYVADIGGNGPPPRSQNTSGGSSGGSELARSRHYVPRQIVLELDSALTPAQADALARRMRLARVASQDFPLIGATISLFRITDDRSVETLTTQLRAETGVRAAQPNFRYVLQDQVSTPVSAEGDPAQYALAKLRLPEAHKLAYGSNVTVAVIDSEIDVAHPEIANAVVSSFDALDSKEAAHVHGTGVAGAIVAHTRLMGSAPRARILAIRAFGVSQSGAESSSFVIMKGINHAAMNGAQVINMSFAGPKDALVERGIAAAAGKGIVMVAASGNAGPKSPPLYPAASPGVIAVSATDAYDKLFSASNRGSHIVVAAPGVDIFLPAPDNKYQMTSGTSFSAAYISGLAALMIERNPQLRPDELRAILMKTARDLGTPGRDDLFGAGEADAYSAVSAVQGVVAPAANVAPAGPAVATEPAPTRAVEATSPSATLSDSQK